MRGHEAELAGAQRTVAAALGRVTAELRGAGIADAGMEARRLLAAALGLSAAQLLARPEQAPAAEQGRRLESFLQRRLSREPLSRILGERDFYGRPFAISPATLDPRPDSETLIAAALDLVVREGWESRPLRILDVGTGSGCLLLTLIAELANATGLGTDISAPALDIARANAERLGLADRTAWRVADMLDGIEGPFDMLLSNPPYVRSVDLAGLDPEVRDYDPLTALDGGADGLGLYRRLLQRIPLVIPKGWIIVEVGYDQADAVAALLGSTGSDPNQTAFYKDVTGKRRCVAMRTRTRAIG